MCRVYILYSASVEMIIAIDDVDGFTLDRSNLEYYWTRKSLSMPTRGCFYSLLMKGGLLTGHLDS